MKVKERIYEGSKDDTLIQMQGDLEELVLSVNKMDKEISIKNSEIDRLDTEIGVLKNEVAKLNKSIKDKDLNLKEVFRANDLLQLKYNEMKENYKHEYKKRKKAEKVAEEWYTKCANTKKPYIEIVDWEDV